MRLSFSLKSEKPKPHSSTVKTRIHPSDFRDLLFVFLSGVNPDVRKVSASKLCEFFFVFRQLLSFFHFPILLLQLWFFQKELKFGQKKESFLNSGTTPGRILSHLDLYLSLQTHIPITAKKNCPPWRKENLPWTILIPRSPLNRLCRSQNTQEVFSLFPLPFSPSQSSLSTEQIGFTVIRPMIPQSTISCRFKDSCQSASFFDPPGIFLAPPLSLFEVERSMLFWRHLEKSSIALRFGSWPSSPLQPVCPPLAHALHILPNHATPLQHGF